MISVASIGECMIELVADEAGWKLGYAGDTFNTLWVMRALLPQNATTDFISAFGTDPFSDRQIAFMAANRIGVSHSPRLAGRHPGLYAITLDRAERSFTYWRSESVAKQLADHAAALKRSLASRQLVYFSGVTLAILNASQRKTLLQAVAGARMEGAIVAFDPNFRSRLWASDQEARAAIIEALALVDIALPTYSDEQALYEDKSPEETATRLFCAGVKEVVVKNGPDAALLVAPGISRWISTVPVAAPVDTTGAGDSFNGAYLACRLRGQEPATATDIAHRVAAITIQTFGALAPAARLRETSVNDDQYS